MSEIQQDSHYPYYLPIHFVKTKKVYYFGVQDEKQFAVGDFAVVETIRGVEMGEVISLAKSTEDLKMNIPLKPVIRKATQQDRNIYEDNKEYARKALDICADFVAKLKLDMNLISAEYTLDRSKVIIIYVADERVDFRELLKELAPALRCRIELRQIGQRDKAKIVGGLGCCGMETCCSRFMSDFDVISINMAKNQMLALNIQKLSGQCGKLMCCLKYEDGMYRDVKANLPKLNSPITYNNKTYRVTSMNILTREAKLENREESLFLPFSEAFKDYKLPRGKEDAETEELSA
ncbi:MAG: stage 0 sporulation protein [Erysipelotrichaceae bacterium]|jgi:cell fate regulator YaaT (PSP1 superfamily)|nr:stage 0 sporulation protein [Erysipelotrichaceae bacterium]